ncbi:MAG: DUF1579 domain-containing protein [Acidobacteria bacterium]|nr:DUF1579 domain-containing protein [Acidobacteriota bacterium]
MRFWKVFPLVAAVGLVFLAAPGAAQQQASVRPQQGIPGPARLGPEGRRLAFLVGAWEEKVRYPGETSGQKAEGGTGRWFARPLLGRFLQFNYDGVGPQGPYRAFGVLIYDGEAANYRMFWFDDAGGVGDYRGNFADENTLSLEHRGRVDGREFRERITYTRVSPGEVRTKIEQAWDAGGYRVYLEAQATRTGAPPQGPMRPNVPPAKQPPM